MPQQQQIQTLADVRKMLPSIYNPASAAAYASTLDRALVLTRCSSLTQIPADVAAWEDMASRIVWAGAFPAATPSKSEKNFNAWVKRISSAIKRARSAANPAAPRPAGVVAHWDEMADYTKSAQKMLGPDGKKLLPGMSDVSIANLRARLADVSPQDVNDANASAAMIAAPAGKCPSLRRSIRFFNSLIINRVAHPSIDHLLPSRPIGALPVLRQSPLDWDLFTPEFLASRNAAIGAAMQPEARTRTSDRFGGKLGRAALRGDRGGARKRKRRVTNKAVATKAHLAALSWLVRHGFENVADAAGFSDIRGLVTEEAVSRAVRVYVERAKTSDVLKTANETSSATTWLGSLATLARRGLGDDDLAWEIEGFKVSEDLETFADREMSATREAFVRMVDYDPVVARTIVLAAQTLHDEALRGLKAWDTLGTHARIEVLHTLAAAAMFALQIGRPLRTRNLNGLTTGGASPQINEPRSGEADPYLIIKKENVKNRRQIENRIHPAYWRIVDDWIRLGREKYIEIHSKRGFHDSDYLFPGKNGMLCRQSFNNIWNRAVRKLGLTGLVPHMMRHVVATLHLAVHPGDYAVVAALLCDSVRTVEKFYARGDGRAAVDLLFETLKSIHPEVAAMLRKVA